MIVCGVVLRHDTERFPFAAFLARHVFRVPRLAELHRHWAAQRSASSLGYEDNLTLRRLMQRLPDESPFYSILRSWVYHVLAPHYGMKISYSQHPKMRVHLAGTGSVSAFHRDANVTGREDQINVYLPFTDVFGGATVWSERSYGREDYVPLELRYGEALLWDGGFLKHGTYANDTDHTRVSCDFRFALLPGATSSAPYSQILSQRPSDLSGFRDTSTSAGAPSGSERENADHSRY